MLSSNNWPVLFVVVVFRLNERLKETARSHLAGDGLREIGPAAGDDDGIVNNLRQQLTLAIQVSSVQCLSVHTRLCLFH